jgi:hypothetical protein
MKLSPDVVAAQIRAMREELADEISAMTAKERRDLRNRSKSSPDLIRQAISAIGKSDMIASAVKKDSEAMHQMLSADRQWASLQGELRAFLNEVSSARLARRRQLDVIATQTFALAKQLIRAPGNEDLIPIYEDMRHTRHEERRKKRRTPKATEPPAE